MGLTYPKPTDLSNVPGIVAAYNMQPSPDGVLVDISGEGNVLNTTAVISTEDGLYFQGEDKDSHAVRPEFTKANADDICTAAMRFKLYKTTGGNVTIFANIKSNADKFYIGANASGYVISTVINSTSTISKSIDVDMTGKWLNVVFVNVAGVTKFYVNGVEATGTSNVGTGGNGGFNIGSTTSEIAHAPIIVSDFKLFNYAFNEQQAIDYHNQFARQIEQKHELSDYGVGRDSDSLSGVFFTISGDFSTQELTAQDVNVPQLDKGTVWLRCDTNGSFRIPYTGSIDVDAIIDYYNGSVWSRKEDSLADLITNNAWLSQSGDYLVFTLTAGEGITSTLIRQGEFQ